MCIIIGTFQSLFKLRVGKCSIEMTKNNENVSAAAHAFNPRIQKAEGERQISESQTSQGYMLSPSLPTHRKKNIMIYSLIMFYNQLK